MNRHKIQEAVRTARVFLQRARTVMDAACTESDGPYPNIWGHTKDTAALKRASMELSRALSEMRKP